MTARATGPRSPPAPPPRPSPVVGKNAGFLARPLLRLLGSGGEGRWKLRLALHLGTTEGLGRMVPYLAWAQRVALEASPEPLGLGDTSWASGRPADQGRGLHGQTRPVTASRESAPSPLLSATPRPPPTVPVHVVSSWGVADGDHIVLIWVRELGQLVLAGHGRDGCGRWSLGAIGGGCGT